MESKVSSAQLEVWAWKEKIYQTIKDMPTGKAIEFVLKQTKELSQEVKQMRIKRN